jgi:hypothetical protein
MSDIKYGACKFCGQCNFDVDCSDCNTTAEATEKATENCTCDEAVKYTTLRKKYETTKEHIDNLFGIGAEAKELIPMSNDIITYLYASAERIVQSDITSVSIQIAAGCQAKITSNSKGQIKVERVETEKYQQQG